MTFPSRRDRGYRASLFRAILWASMWENCGSDALARFGVFNTPRSARLYDRVREHRNRAWARLFLFAGHVVH